MERRILTSVVWTGGRFVFATSHDTVWMESPG